MVPDDSLTIRERAVAAWPTAWQGQNLRDILIDARLRRRPPLARPARRRTATGSSSPTSSRRSRSTPGYTPEEVRRALEAQGGAELPGHVHQRPALRAAHVRQHRRAPLMKKRVAAVHARAATARPAAASGSGRESLSVTFAGPRHRRDLAAAAGPAGRHRPPLRGRDRRRRWRSWRRSTRRRRWSPGGSPRTSSARLAVLLDLGLGYLSLERSTPTLSPGELQRLRLATQVRSNLFGVVYVLDEPSAGLHPADTEALLRALDRLKAVGQLAVRRRARPRRDPPRRLDRRRRPGRGRARRPRPLQRPARRARGGSRRRRPAATSSATDGSAGRTPRHAQGLAPAGRRHAEQPATASTPPSRSGCSRP